jgi:hypothetical protein
MKLIKNPYLNDYKNYLKELKRMNLENKKK